MTTQSRTVRVFLSSTFRDFAEERDLLVRKIFPELRRKCRERQVELVDVDLRWGITEEEAQQGKVLPICLAEIDRSRPFFMGFIGERYGWVPEKEQYDLSLIMEQSWLDEHRGGKSVTELEMLHGVLNNPAMEDRAFFYFRDSAYSQAKGAAYLSEGPQEKSKLEALKDRIRRSGFPVVENYRSPEDLAEHVRDDLWKLIDEAFPESEVPDALARERMRHEAFTASRLGLYIGGEHYFDQIDSAMLAETRRPVLVTGDSGGGKSALLANWASRFSQNNPSAILLTHCLATGADAAQPVNMAVRILREISRIIGEELVLEGDPSKALHMLSPWFAKVGAFAAQKGGLFVLVLDGLDKMDAQHDMGWWPSKIPDGVCVVASCLSGKIFDAIASRMDWEKLLVSPLQREDCETFIASHLGKYRKSLTPELTSKVFAHPLSGNPLFLRTLLEELRVFGVHEELGLKLDHYLTSQTVDDLFERVLERVEADNSPESVRALLEVLWAAKESFAEDELLAVSGLPPAGWAPIHIALDESLIGAGGRLAFSHDYLRKAVEDRYLPSVEDRRRIQNRMAEFCAQAMAGGRKDISHYVRRHSVEHFLEVKDWDNATAALSDLEFIEARAIAQELPAMLKDYAEAVRLLPEGEKERQTEAARRAELDRYAKEMVEYSAAWSRIRDGSGEAEPTLPRPVESVRLWTEEEIAAESKRITEAPNRLDIVKAFRVFVATNSAPLQKYSTQEGFAANLARNDAPAGPVHEEGKRRLEPLKCLKLLKKFVPEEIYNPLPACQAVLEGHTGSVSSLVLSWDGRRVVSGSSDSTLRIWDVQTGECLKVLKGHKETEIAGILALILSADGRILVSASDDSTIRIWDVETGECLQILELPELVYILQLSTDARFIVSGGGYHDAPIIWDVETGKCLRVLTGHTDTVNSLVLSADGRRVVSASDDGTLRVWDVLSGQCLKVLEGHTAPVCSIALSADGQRVVSGSKDSTLRVWDLQSGECQAVLEGHAGNVSSLVLSWDGHRVVSGSSDSTLRIWDMATNKCLMTIKGNDGFGGPIILFADGRHLLTSHDNSIKIFELETGQCVKDFERHIGYITSFVLSADGRIVISGSTNDSSVLIWDLEKGKYPKATFAHTKSVTSLVMSPVNDFSVSISRDKTLRVWDVKTGQCLRVLEGHAESVNSLAISPDGRRVISSSWDKALRIWDVQSGKCIQILEGHTESVDTLVISNDGLRVVSGSMDKTLRIWDMYTGRCLKVLDGHTELVSSLVISADGRRIFSGSADQTIRIWDLETGECLKILEGHSGWVQCLILSSDGHKLISSSGDRGNNLIVWDLNTGNCLLNLVGAIEEPQRILNLGISADGCNVLQSCLSEYGKVTKVWNLKKKQCIDSLYVDGMYDCGDSKIYLSHNLHKGVWVSEFNSFAKHSLFYLHGIICLTKYTKNRIIGGGFIDGRVEFFDIENLPLGPFITTAQREFISEDLPAGSVTARPSCCGQPIHIPSAIADRIEHWTNEGAEGGYSDPALLLQCPCCSTPLRMNPFFVNIQANN
jgi:WD40 repeat protein